MPERSQPEVLSADIAHYCCSPIPLAALKSRCGLPLTALPSTQVLNRHGCFLARSAPARNRTKSEIHLKFDYRSRSMRRAAAIFNFDMRIMLGLTRAMSDIGRVLEPQATRFTLASNSRSAYGIPEHAIAVDKIAGVRAPEDMTAPDYIPLECQACSAT